MVPLYSLFVTDKTPHRSPEHYVIAKNIPPPLAIKCYLVAYCHGLPFISCNFGFRVWPSLKHLSVIQNCHLSDSLLIKYKRRSDLMAT